MFKGLRTKIESEQRGQTSTTRNNGQPVPSPAKGIAPAANINQDLFSLSDRATIPDDHLQSNEAIIASAGPTNIHTIEDGAREEVKNKANAKCTKGDDTGDPASNRDGFQDFPEDIDVQQIFDIDQLRGQISKLKEQLRVLMREKEDSNDQNAQLYQLIEKLRRNLETEQETKSSLQTRISELERLLKEKTESYQSISNSTNSIAFNKSFNPDAGASEPNISNDVETLRNEVIELQAQVAKKNRQLKIRQQNLTDIKRTLQKEILDHSRTQEELARLQRQLHSSDQPQMPHQNPQQHSSKQDKSTPASQNGSNNGEISDAYPKVNPYQASGDKGHELAQAAAGSQLSSAALSSVGDDTLSLGLGGNVQFDGISCLSRSSASVDDFESNDLQQNNYNKEVSHEYLRNVLYRYMTSTDNETTQHLVRAISVLMDFSPEQSAAIKKAMISKSSWLRLK